MTVRTPVQRVGSQRTIPVLPGAHALFPQLDGDHLRAEAAGIASARRRAEGRILEAYATTQDQAALRERMREQLRRGNGMGPR